MSSPSSSATTASNPTPHLHLHQSWLFARTHVLRPHEEFWAFPPITRLVPRVLPLVSQLASTFLRPTLSVSDNKNDSGDDVDDTSSADTWATPLGNDLLSQPRIAHLISYCLQAVPILRKFLLVRNELGVFSTYTRAQCHTWLKRRVRLPKIQTLPDSSFVVCGSDTTNPGTVLRKYTHVAEDGALCWTLEDAREISQVAQAQCLCQMFEVPPGEFATHLALSTTGVDEANAMTHSNTATSAAVSTNVSSATPVARRNTQQTTTNVRPINTSKSPFVFFLQHFCTLALIVNTGTNVNINVVGDGNNIMASPLRATIVLKLRNDDASPNVDMLRKMCNVVSTLRPPQQQSEEVQTQAPTQQQQQQQQQQQPPQITIIFLAKHAPKNTNMVGIRREYPHITLRWWPSSFFETDWFHSCNNAPMAAIRAAPAPQHQHNHAQDQHRHHTSTISSSIGTCGHPLNCGIPGDTNIVIPVTPIPTSTPPQAEGHDHSHSHSHDHNHVVPPVVGSDLNSRGDSSMCQTCHWNLQQALSFQRSRTTSTLPSLDVSQLLATCIDDIVARIWDLRVGDVMVHQRGKFKSVRQVIGSPLSMAGEDDGGDILGNAATTNVASGADGGDD